ncbi:MAG TPA: SDR family oxidoreductase, partial [Bacteroidetes bacterium]|nr:SDR family oxidoreductase [Bacteroidota bacterium]
MKDKVVIVTGASSGIGEALAKVYAAAGGKVVLAARNLTKLDALAQALKKAGGDTLTVKTDVSQRADCEALIAQTIAHYGRIDFLINNAGISMRALASELDPEVIEQVMQVNFFGTVYCTQAALPHLLETKGSIVGVSSIAGFRGLPGRTGYSASKFAMHGYLESLRTELLKTGVHVLLACPGFTASNIRKAALIADGSHQGDTPLKEQKLMSAQEVAQHIFKAVMRRKRTLVLTRQGKLTVLMNKLFPAWMD